MIISIRMANYKAFSTAAELTLKADMRYKRFEYNVFNGAGFSILKSACMFGPNNEGKSCFIGAVKCIRDIMLGKYAGNDIISNVFEDDAVSSLGMSFCYEGKAYSYDIRYDCARKRFVYECFRELFRDRRGHEKERIVFLRDSAKGRYRFDWDKSLRRGMKAVPGDTAAIYGLDADHPAVCECRRIMAGFASLIDVVDMDDISLDKTIGALKYNRPIKEKTVRFVKMSGVFIDGLEYADEQSEMPREAANGSETVTKDDYMKLYSYHSWVRKKAVETESSNTLKLIALASYIVDALDSGRILVIDQLGNGMHPVLLKALVKLFNRERNARGQLIFTTHCVALMDRMTLLREDQICFVDRNAKPMTYRLSDFSDLPDVKSGDNTMVSYLAGYYEAIPEPNYQRLDDEDITA